MLMIECPDVVNSIMNEFFLADHGDFPLQSESPFGVPPATVRSEMSNHPEGTHLESTSPCAAELGADLEGGPAPWGALEALDTLESAGQLRGKPEFRHLKDAGVLPVEKRISAGLLGYRGGASVL